MQADRRTRRRPGAAGRAADRRCGRAAGRADAAGAAVPAVAARSPAARRRRWPVRWARGCGRSRSSTSVWALAAGLPPRERGPLGALSRAALVSLATVAVLGGAACRLSPGAIYPGGDEPHYLVDHAEPAARSRSAHRRQPRARRLPRVLTGARSSPITSCRRRRRRHLLHPSRSACSLLVAPGFALGGYRGASLTVLRRARSSPACCLWQWLRAVTGAPGAATFGWLAIVTSAPFVLHGFAIYPEIPAALAVLVALAWRAGSARHAGHRDRARPGAWRAAVAWLEVRADGRRRHGPAPGARADAIARRQLAIAVPAVLAVVAWLAWFACAVGHALADGALRRGAPDGVLANLAAGLPGLFFDQEYGIVAACPGAGDGGRRLVAALATRRPRAAAGARDRRCRC